MEIIGVIRVDFEQEKTQRIIHFVSQKVENIIFLVVHHFFNVGDVENAVEVSFGLCPQTDVKSIEIVANDHNILFIILLIPQWLKCKWIIIFIDQPNFLSFEIKTENSINFGKEQSVSGFRVCIVFKVEYEAYLLVENVDIL